MSEMSLTTALASLVSIAGLWILLFWLYRDLCVDKFRQDMFTLRDELFDAARAGAIGFDHPAYGLLRRTMNGFIRFAHRFTLLQALLMVAIARDADQANENIESFPAQWNDATRDVSLETSQILTRYRFRMNVLVVRYVLVSSPILLLTVVVPVIGWISLQFCMTQLLHALKSPLDGLDSAAMAEGQA
jgi:hypothetical protein